VKYFYPDFVRISSRRRAFYISVQSYLPGRHQSDRTCAKN